MPMNMGYCRFGNTLAALRECEEHLDDELTGSEQAARKRPIKLCNDIAADYSEGDDQ